MNSTDRHGKPLAYKNERFLDSDDARPLRILAEHLEPLHTFHREHVRDAIVFFGSARLTSEGPLGHYYDAARELARLVTTWSKNLPSRAHRYVVCTGGGGGIMEAANRGASEAGGKTIGLNIGLPHEQQPNPYITRELTFEFHYFFMRKLWFAHLARALVVFRSKPLGLNIGLPHEQQPNPYITRELTFEFHYFFMRKLWFAHLARALVVFPGGFGTLDEFTEILTLMQTKKIARPIPIVLFGSSYWNEIINFDALVRH